MSILNVFFEFKFIDLALPFLTLVALFLAYFQLTDLRKHKKIEFTYQLYRDFFIYLNEEGNSDQKTWLFGGEVNNIDETKIGDLLEQFEAIWSLQNKKMVEKDIVYDLFAYYITKASHAKNPTAKEYIEKLRIEETNTLGYTEDIFIGYETLLKQISNKRVLYKKRFMKHLKKKKK